MRPIVALLAVLATIAFVGQLNAVDIPDDLDLGDGELDEDYELLRQMEDKHRVSVCRNCAVVVRFVWIADECVSLITGERFAARE